MAWGGMAAQDATAQADTRPSPCESLEGRFVNRPPASFSLHTAVRHGGRRRSSVGGPRETGRTPSASAVDGHGRLRRRFVSVALRRMAACRPPYPSRIATAPSRMARRILSVSSWSRGSGSRGGPASAQPSHYPSGAPGLGRRAHHGDESDGHVALTKCVPEAAMCLPPGTERGGGLVAGLGVDEQRALDHIVEREQAAKDHLGRDDHCPGPSGIRSRMRNDLRQSLLHSLSGLERRAPYSTGQAVPAQRDFVAQIVQSSRQASSICDPVGSVTLT